ncbi:MAG: hypothetical protein M0Z46_02055 [Actinomycetota bacterium]|nr:hypothetical protein [Actinomycetota bacterium]
MTTKTSLFADAVVRDRIKALGERASAHATRERRRTPKRARLRTTRRLGPLRLAPGVVAVTTLFLGLFAGTAYAYFSATGSGTGEVSVGHLQAVVVEHATATVTTRLFPGGTGTLDLSLTNPNTFSVTLIGVTGDGPVTVTGGGSACTSGSATTPGTSGVSVEGSLATGLSDTLAPGSTSLTFANGALMATSSNTTCQGATFHIPVAVTVHT